MANSLTIDLKGDDVHLKAVTTRVQASMQKLQARFQKVANAAKIMLTAGALAIGGFVKLAAEQEDAEKRLAAVLEATGNAAGFSIEQLKDFASQLQQVTVFGDEATLSNLALLATFKNIKGDNFKRTAQAALDMATVMRSDVSTSMLQLGKAINDPILGMTALSRAGVQFTQDQKDLVKSLVESGDVLKAQDIILKEVEGQMGGASQAAAKSFKGQVLQLKNTLGDTGELIGAAFIPMLKEFAVWAKGASEIVSVWVTTNKESIITFTKWAAGIGGAIIVINTFMKVLTLLNLRLLAVIASKIAVLAMSGPTGWAQLAVGMGLIVGAGVFVEEQFRRVKDSIDDAKKGIQETSKEGGKSGLGGKVSPRNSLQQRIREDRAFRGIKDPLAGVSNPILRDQIIKEQNRAIQAQQALDKNNKLLGDIHLTLKSPSPVALGAFGK